MIARITRSQLAAAIGNIGLVIPSALRVRAASGVLAREIVSRRADGALRAALASPARRAGRSSSPRSPACSCGCRASSRVGSRTGPSTGACPRPSPSTGSGASCGRRTMAWFSRFFLRNIAGFGGNVSLGLMLGMTPVVGKVLRPAARRPPRHALDRRAHAAASCASGPEALSSRGFLARRHRHRDHRRPELRRELRAGPRRRPARPPSQSLRPLAPLPLGPRDLHALPLAVLHPPPRNLDPQGPRPRLRRPTPHALTRLADCFGESTGEPWQAKAVIERRGRRGGGGGRGARRAGRGAGPRGNRDGRGGRFLR